MNKIIKSILVFLKGRFNLSHDQDNNRETIKSIEKGVDFRGINIWTLIFAIFIASIGLNVNSTAVIIGAMLISPLMGPIMGLGLSVGIYDFPLLKKSLKNLSIAVVISVLTSAIYFVISPLNEAQSELLARTTPTIYDVLIALFGGLAGIVAGATKEKGNAIPGVAIATALMPPLCTAGFGLATGNIYYFLGAFYLFFINAVMISLSTFLMVRFLRFPLKQFIDESRSKRVKHAISLIVIITVLPSVYFAYKIVKETIFRSNAISFVNREFNFEKTQVINKTFTYNPKEGNQIVLILTGEKIDSIAQRSIERKLGDYSLPHTQLILKQGMENVAALNFDQLKSGIIEEMYHKNQQTLKDKDEKIRLLENELRMSRNTIAIAAISEELHAINPKVVKFSAFKTPIYDVRKQLNDTSLLVYLSVTHNLSPSERQTISNWLSKRLESDKVKLMTER